MNKKNIVNNFSSEVQSRISSYYKNKALHDASALFMLESTEPKYSYNFSWLGRPIIQYPQDIIAAQELIWEIKPDLIIETGIAHGGSLIFSASMLAQLDLIDAIIKNEIINPNISRRKVVGIDIDIRAHNKDAILRHPMSSRIEMIEGSSIDLQIIEKVKKIASNYSKVMICLDSNHTHAHVLKELEAYAPLTTVGSYCIVYDTIIEDLPVGTYPDRSWGPGNNPKSAVYEYLQAHPEFSIDKNISQKLQISVAPDGYLKKIY
jgi:cephalosporin hydroxylase